MDYATSHLVGEPETTIESVNHTINLISGLKIQFELKLWGEKPGITSERTPFFSTPGMANWNPLPAMPSIWHPLLIMRWVWLSIMEGTNLERFIKTNIKAWYNRIHLWAPSDRPLGCDSSNYMRTSVLACILTGTHRTSYYFWTNTKLENETLHASRPRQRLAVQLLLLPGWPWREGHRPPSNTCYKHRRPPPKKGLPKSKTKNRGARLVVEALYLEFQLISYCKTSDCAPQGKLPVIRHEFGGDWWILQDHTPNILARAFLKRNTGFWTTT